jgi:hypothetical protein
MRRLPGRDRAHRSRYAAKFEKFPFRHAVLDLLTVLPAQVRRSTGQIRIPEVAREGDYDLVCFGSPTWWFKTNLPLRSYLKSDEAGKVLAGKPFAAYVVCRRYWSINLKEVRKLGTAQGGRYLDGTRFQFAGGQIRSFLSLISYYGKGEMRERYLGVKIPPDQPQAGLPRPGPGVREQAGRQPRSRPWSLIRHLEPREGRRRCCWPDWCGRAR